MKGTGGKGAGNATGTCITCGDAGHKTVVHHLSTIFLALCSYATSSTPNPTGCESPTCKGNNRHPWLMIQTDIGNVYCCPNFFTTLFKDKGKEFTEGPCGARISAPGFPSGIFRIAIGKLKGKEGNWFQGEFGAAAAAVGLSTTFKSLLDKALEGAGLAPNGSALKKFYAKVQIPNKDDTLLCPAVPGTGADGKATGTGKYSRLRLNRHMRKNRAKPRDRGKGNQFSGSGADSQSNWRAPQG